MHPEQLNTLYYYFPYTITTVIPNVKHVNKQMKIFIGNIVFYVNNITFQMMQTLHCFWAAR